MTIDGGFLLVNGRNICYNTENYRKAAFLRCADGVIGRSAASALYGDTLKNSATRLEKYAACAFAHFMEFGLQIRERDQYELKAADM